MNVTEGPEDLMTEANISRDISEKNRDGALKCPPIGRELTLAIPGVGLVPPQPPQTVFF